MSRYGGGARYQIGGDNYFVGFNSVFISDQENDGNRITENAYSQNLNSIDWEYVFKSLRFMGEHARSDTRTKPSSGDKTRTDAWANTIKMRGDAFGFNLDARIENVAHDFSTLGGGATPDRRRYYGNISRQITKHLRGYLMSDYYYNRIDDTSTATLKTNNSIIETGLTQTNLFSRKDMVLSGIYRFGKDKNVDGTNERIKNRVKLSLSDRLFKELKYKAAVEGIFEEDVPDQTMGNNYLYSLDLSWRRKLTKDILIRPELFYSYRFTDNVTTLGDDKVNTVRFNLTGDYKGNNRFGMGAELIGSNVFQGTDSCNKSWNLFYERALKMVKDATFKIDYKVNMYDFSGDHPGDDNYTEKRFIMSFNMRI
jgi:hypothetical protein